MAGNNFQRFQRAKEFIRAHPGWSDEDVAEACGILPRELAVGDGPNSPQDIIRTARRDVAAGQSQEQAMRALDPEGAA